MTKLQQFWYFMTDKTWQRWRTMPLWFNSAEGSQKSVCSDLQRYDFCDSYTHPQGVCAAMLIWNIGSGSGYNNTYAIRQRTGASIEIWKVELSCRWSSVRKHRCTSSTNKLKNRIPKYTSNRVSVNFSITVSISISLLFFRFECHNSFTRYLITWQHLHTGGFSTSRLWGF